MLCLIFATSRPDATLISLHLAHVMRCQTAISTFVTLCLSFGIRSALAETIPSMTPNFATFECANTQDAITQISQSCPDADKKGSALIGARFNSASVAAPITCRCVVSTHFSRRRLMRLAFRFKSGLICFYRRTNTNVRSKPRSLPHLF